MIMNIALNQNNKAAKSIVKPHKNNNSVIKTNAHICLIRILFQYLENVNPTLLLLAKEIMKDCDASTPPRNPGTPRLARPLMIDYVMLLARLIGVRLNRFKRGSC